MMTTASTYKLLTAAIQFRDAYKNLCKVYNMLPDADFTEQYPLGQIDLFDKNTCDGLTAWINCQTTKLINNLPDRVVNPACLTCLLSKKKVLESERRLVGPLKVATKPDGSCALSWQHGNCCHYPYVVFDVPMIKSFLMHQTYSDSLKPEADKEYDDTAYRVLYNNLLAYVGIAE